MQSSSSETSQTDGCLPCRPRFRLRPHVDSRRQTEGLRLNTHRRQHPVNVSYLRRCDGLARDTFSQCKSTARSCLSLVLLFFRQSDLFAQDSSRLSRTRTPCSIHRRNTTSPKGLSVVRIITVSALHPSPRDGGWPTVAARQLRKFPSPRARRTGAIRYGESRGKGTETTQIRLTG